MDVACTIHLTPEQIDEIRNGKRTDGGPLITVGYGLPADYVKQPGGWAHPIVPVIEHQTRPVFSSTTERVIYETVHAHLSKYHHIIPLAKTTQDITKAIMDEYGDAVEVISHWSDGMPRVNPGGSVRSYKGRQVLDETVCRAIANHWGEGAPKPFSKHTAAKWLGDEGYNRKSASPALGYLEGAGVVVAIEKRYEGRKSRIMYKWGRRPHDDEQFECHGPTGIDKVRGILPVVRAS